MYLIYRVDHGRMEYVAPAGSEKSYTQNPVRARRFASEDAARRHCCGNEHVISRAQVLEY